MMSFTKCKLMHSHKTSVNAALLDDTKLVVERDLHFLRGYTYQAQKNLSGIGFMQMSQYFMNIHCLLAFLVLSITRLLMKLKNHNQ